MEDGLGSLLLFFGIVLSGGDGNGMAWLRVLIRPW